VLSGVVGAGLTVPVEVGPYGTGDSEYAAAQRLLRRAQPNLGPRFAGYVVGDGVYATAPFLHTAGETGLPVAARLKADLPLLAAAVRDRFDGQPLHAMFQEGNDRVEVWDYDHFDSWGTLDWPELGVLRYHRHKPDGTVVHAEWLTDFPVGKPGSLSFHRMAKSRWEIENRGFNDGKNRYGMEPICQRQANSIPIVWLLIAISHTRLGEVLGRGENTWGQTAPSTRRRAAECFRERYYRLGTESSIPAFSRRSTTTGCLACEKSRLGSPGPAGTG
jgi:hypothetical protein